MSVIASCGQGPAAKSRGWQGAADHDPGLEYLYIDGQQAGLSDRQIEAVRQFSALRWFDVVHYPGIDAGQANRYNQLQQPWYFEGARALLGSEREQYFDDYKFNLRPATDNRPYFFHFLKWRTLPEILSLRGQGGLPLVESGYLILFLGHPLYAVAVVLAAFLVFAGLGSAMSARWPTIRPVGGIVFIALIYLFALPPLLQALIYLHEVAKVLISCALIAPLAFLMGLPFPQDLDRVARNSVSLIPWAWGINGCASVLAAIFATVLAIHAGFVVVVLVALALYILASMSLPATAGD